MNKKINGICNDIIRSIPEEDMPARLASLSKGLYIKVHGDFGKGGFYHSLSTFDKPASEVVKEINPSITFPDKVNEFHNFVSTIQEDSSHYKIFLDSNPHFSVSNLQGFSRNLMEGRDLKYENCEYKDVEHTIMIDQTLILLNECLRKTNYSKFLEHCQELEGFSSPYPIYHEGKLQKFKFVITQDRNSLELELHPLVNYKSAIFGTGIILIAVGSLLYLLSPIYIKFQ